ncbi:MAG: glutathione S-transferase family protein [Gammaproteobacteria bacterium AqS3]|nr:glutathione S-transferase family protein [Gammaproteobacteria bacterium AqS3]
MKLYHCFQARSQRSLWTLEELGLDYELTVLPFPPRVFQKEYKQVNPLGTIPYLVDGDVEMSESSGICLYLVERYGPTELAIGRDEADYGAYLNWLFRSDATLTFPLTLVLRYTELEPEERRIAQVADDYRTWFLARWRCVGEALSDGREYLVGGRFTIADICVSYGLQLALSLDIQEALAGPVRPWWDRLNEREAMQKALQL